MLQMVRFDRNYSGHLQWMPLHANRGHRRIHHYLCCLTPQMLHNADADTGVIGWRLW